MQHANHRPKFSLSSGNSIWAFSGYGWTTVKYLGSSSPGGGVTARFGIRNRLLNNADEKNTGSFWLEDQDYEEIYRV
jgi:hypothetical protein